MMEIWKDIEGYECRYEVSSHGRIRTKDRWVRIGRKDTYESKGHLIKGYRGKYHKVTFSLGNVKSTFSVHRLVAKAFIPNVFNKPHINHIDGDKMNNKVDNLEWVTHAENMAHAKENDLNEGTRKPVAQYNLNGEFIRSFKSINEASEVTGLNYSGIRGAAQRKAKSSGGFIWREYTSGEDDLIIKEKITGAKDGKKEVHQYTKDGEYIRSFDSMIEASESVGVSIYAISKCATGIHKTSAGYIWKLNKLEVM